MTPVCAFAWGVGRPKGIGRERDRVQCEGIDGMGLNVLGLSFP